MSTDPIQRAATSTQLEVRHRIEKQVDKIRAMRVPKLEGSAQELLNKFHPWHDLFMLLLKRHGLLFLLKNTFDGSDPNDIIEIRRILLCRRETR